MGYHPGFWGSEVYSSSLTCSNGLNYGVTTLAKTKRPSLHSRNEAAYGKRQRLYAQAAYADARCLVYKRYSLVKHRCKAYMVSLRGVKSRRTCVFEQSATRSPQEANHAMLNRDDGAPPRSADSEPDDAMAVLLEAVKIRRTSASQGNLFRPF